MPQRYWEGGEGGRGGLAYLTHAYTHVCMYVRTYVQHSHIHTLAHSHTHTQHLTVQLQYVAIHYKDVQRCRTCCTSTNQWSTQSLHLEDTKDRMRTLSTAHSPLPSPGWPFPRVNQSLPKGWTITVKEVQFLHMEVVHIPPSLSPDGQPLPKGGP